MLTEVNLKFIVAQAWDKCASMCIVCESQMAFCQTGCARAHTICLQIPSSERFQFMTVKNCECEVPQKVFVYMCMCAYQIVDPAPSKLFETHPKYAKTLVFPLLSCSARLRVKRNE